METPNTTETPTTNKISLYEFARWAALLEAVDIIADKCKDKGIDFDSVEGMRYIKPLDIQDFVNTRTDTLLMKIKTAREIEKNLNSIKFLQIEKQLQLFEGPIPDIKPVENADIAPTI